ncbi:homoserine dehydrogenase [Candidatus Lokiarchaeum ossiferum]|uniref:homoserine dehydrogenase n=1 Tax=Candidatus Lokiarchaeum ossiferum TaxID=2951803 RepID=UPI00352D241D
MVSLILVGFGGVGRALVEIMQNDADYLRSNFGFVPVVKAICERQGSLIDDNGLNLSNLLNLGDIASSPYWQAGLTTLEIIQEIKADILVECSWASNDGEPAFTVLKTAMQKKMHIVSSNKPPFYLKYGELKQIAQEKGVMMRIESTVLSAVPALAAETTLAGAHISSIRGILNGTCNYILTRMTQSKLPFKEALKEAQDLGYAEADPTMDINGKDAAGKIVILSDVLLGWNKTIHDMKVQGIEDVTAEDIEQAKREHKYIKHVCQAKDGKLSAGVELVPMDSSLAIMGSLNLVEFETKHAGPFTFIGRGAGGFEAASGVLSDIIHISTQLYDSKKENL